jgi:hypothetical protein
MPKTDTQAAHPFQALEEQAYHAFREWPIWLALRERELSEHLQADRAASDSSRAARTGQPSAKPPRH